MKRLPWRKAKTLAVLAFRRLAAHPVYSSELEIEIESGGSFIVIETSVIGSPTYIETE